MSEANKALIKKAFEATNKGEVAELAANLDPELHKAAEQAIQPHHR